MYKIRYGYDHGSWIEDCSTLWIRKEAVIEALPELKRKDAIRIQVLKLSDVTKNFMS